MIINTNMAALNTIRQLGVNEKSTQSALAKLSSGLRINSAADDAAGLAISEKMRGQINGLNQATSNAQTGINMVSTAEGALNETTSILQRMRELAVQGSNDTNTTSDREAIQTEMNQLTSEINRIGNTTEFNTQQLLRGTTAPVVTAAQNVTTNTAGVTGVPVGDTSDLVVNANSVVAQSSTASVQGNTSAATGRVGVTDQTTVSVKGVNSSIVISGLNFTSTTLSSAVPNGQTINIKQLGTTNTASNVTVTGTGAGAVIDFNIGTDADGKSLFTGTNRGDLTNFLKGITGGVGYAGSGVTITVPEDPNANGPASAEALVNMPDQSQVASAATIYTGSLTGGVSEVKGVSTFSITAGIKEAGDTITVGGKTFTAVTSGANAANGQFNIGSVQGSSTADAAADFTTDLSNSAGTAPVWAATTAAAAAAATGTATLTFEGVTVTLSVATAGAATAAGVVQAGATGTAATVLISTAATVTQDVDAFIAGLNAIKNQQTANGSLAHLTFGDTNNALIITGDGSLGVSQNTQGITFNANTTGMTDISTGVTTAPSTLGVDGQFDITVGITTYSLKQADLVKFDGTLSNDEALALIKGATDSGGIALSTVADVTYNADGELNVVSKASGATSDVTMGASAGNTTLINTMFGTATTTDLDGLDTGATAADQARSLRVAINANSTLGAHYTASGTANAGEIMMTENATKADGTSIATVTTAGSGANDKLVITDLSGKNLSQVTIVKGAIQSVDAVLGTSTTLDSMKLTEGTGDSQLNGIKVTFTGITTAAGADALTTSWDAATQTITVGGTIGTGATSTATTFKNSLQAALRTSLVASAGIASGVTLTVSSGAAATGGAIIAAMNTFSMTFGAAAGGTATDGVTGISSVAGADSMSGKVYGYQITSGTKSTEFNGVSVKFNISTAGAADALTTTWDAATQTITVGGTIAAGAASTAASFEASLQSVLRTDLGKLGFEGASALTVSAGGDTASTGASIVAAMNAGTMVFGSAAVGTGGADGMAVNGGAKAKSSTIDTSMALISGSQSTEFNGVKVSFSGLQSNGSPTNLTSTWDAANQTMNVTGNILNTETAANFQTLLQDSLRTSFDTAGFQGGAALTVVTGASSTTNIAANLNGQTMTFGAAAGGTGRDGATAVVAHGMAVDQKNGDLTITLSDTTPNNNTAAKIQAAVQALGTFKSSTGDVDFSKYLFTSEGDWDTKAVGEDITKANTSLVGGTREVKGDYSFDITKAFAVGDRVNIKGQVFTAVASGAIGSKNEFDVAGGDINNQAISLRNAIGLNSTLAATYTTTGTGATINMTELRATGTDLAATDEKVTATGTPGQYSVNISTLLTKGAAFELDGQKITASDDVANTGYSNGTAFRAAADAAGQTAAIAHAINTNATLNKIYSASVDSNTGALVLDQTADGASATAPAIQTLSSSEGSFDATLQIGANTGQTMTVTINDMRALALGISGTDSGATVTASNGAKATLTTVASASNGSDNNNVEFTLDISTSEKATAAISIIDDATAKVSAERSNLGAVQNRLEHTINNLGTSSQNITSAEASIRDVDMAAEMTNFQKNNILQQAAQAMLAQANQQGQGVLQLLR